MRFERQPSLPGPIAAAVDGVLEGTGGQLTQSDREMMAWTEGLLTAAAIGPERTHPEQWAQAVFGPERKYADAGQAQASMAVLGIMYNAILADLRRMGADYEPFFLEHIEDGQELELAERWAAGFLTGTRLGAEFWESLMRSRQGKLSLAVIVSLLTDSAGNSLLLEGDAEEIAAARQDALQWLGLSVFEISEYFRAHAKRGEPTSVDPFRKIGRNEPCPCGSGRKFKKCCLQQAA